MLCNTLLLLPCRGSKVPATCSKAVSDFLQQQQPPFSSFLGTTLMLMAELARGADSPYAPYFATLPAATDCLLNWSEEEKQLLAGARMRASIIIHPVLLPSLCLCRIPKYVQYGFGKN